METGFDRQNKIKEEHITLVQRVDFTWNTRNKDLDTGAIEYVDLDLSLRVYDYADNSHNGILVTIWRNGCERPIAKSHIKLFGSNLQNAMLRDCNLSEIFHFVPEISDLNNEDIFNLTKKIHAVGSDQAFGVDIGYRKSGIAQLMLAMTMNVLSQRGIDSLTIASDDTLREIKDNQLPSFTYIEQQNIVVQ